MNFTVRKVERRTIWEASKPVSLKPECFTKLKVFPYVGNIDNEEEFLSYLQDLYWEDWYSVCDELETMGMQGESAEISNLFEGDLSKYSDTSEKGEDSWFEIGEIDHSYTKLGGFNPRVDTMG